MSITTIIVIVTAIVSFIAFRDDALRDKMIFNPYTIDKRRQWYRFITSGLIHADMFHLLINMFVFYQFGQIVENYFRELFEERATLNFMLLYFGGMIVSVIPTYKKNKENPAYNALGASGAVAAIVFAYILFNPLQQLLLFFLIRLPGIVFGALYLVYCYYAAKRKGDFINHDAHFYGALYGFIFPLILHPQLLQHFLNQMPFLHGAF